MEQGKVRILTKSKSLDEQIKHFKDELNVKFEHFYKDLDIEIESRHLSREAKEKIIEYFKGFINTFSAVYIVSQVEDSRHFELASESTEGIFLSTLASLIPFLERAISTNIKSVRDLLDSKEMKTAAKKIKELRSDSSELSQLIGKTAHQIVLNNDKQQQVVDVTAEDLKDSSLAVFQKLVRIIEQIGEEIDVYLYTKVYRTPSERLGNKDANELIAKWLNGAIDVDDVEREFVKVATTTQTEEKKTEERTVVELENFGNSKSECSNRECCNMF